MTKLNFQGGYLIRGFFFFGEEEGSFNIISFNLLSSFQVRLYKLSENCHKILTKLKSSFLSKRTNVKWTICFL